MSVVLELGSLGTPETEVMLSKPNFSLQDLCIVRETGGEKSLLGKRTKNINAKALGIGFNY